MADLVRDGPGEEASSPDAIDPGPPADPNPRPDTGPDGTAEPVETVELSRLRGDEPHWVNVPNGLTFLRALLVPVILWLLTLETSSARWWAFAIFVFAAATDSVDGWVARRWHGVTRWGQLADPIADKLLIGGALASLAAVGDLPWWAVWVIIARELAVTVLRVRLVADRDVVMPASWWGKAKTISQVVAVGVYLVPGVDATLRDGLLFVAVALTLWSGVEYGFRAGRLGGGADVEAAG